MVAAPRRMLLPAELAAFEGWPAGRRTLRDWAVDALLFGFAGILWVENTRTFPPEGVDFVPGWMVTINPWVGAAACLALWWRRRAPIAVAAALVPALLLAGAALGAAMVAVLTTAVHRPWSRAAAVTGAYLIVTSYYALYSRPPGVERPVVVASTLLLFVVPFCLGTAVRARRLLVAGLRRDAELARREQLLRMRDTRRAERERLAREMHDVLAHRISLLGVHAGALAYRTARATAGDGPPLGAAEVGEAAEVIQDNARKALDELAEVLSVLRSDDALPDALPDLPDTPPGAPPGDPVRRTPGLADLPRLVAEAEAAGQRVRYDLGVEAASPSPRVQQTAYRVVQEGLTNARRHAPGAPVSVRVEGERGGMLAVTVENPVAGGPVGRVEAVGSGGNGLAGLRERVALDGGELEHRLLADSFRLTARLPWRS